MSRTNPPTDSSTSVPQLLYDLIETTGVAGHEQAVLGRIEAQLSGNVTECSRDGMGNLICTVEGEEPTTVGVIAHADEIGFVVGSITEDGFLAIEPLGSWQAPILAAKSVLVHGSQCTLSGTVATQSYLPTVDIAPTDCDDLYVDVGLDRAQLVERVSVGDYVTMDRELQRMGEQYVGHALDNRAGVYAVCTAIGQLSSPQYTVKAIFTVEEELGARGVRGLSETLDLDAALVIDSTLANDTPVHRSAETITELGSGVGIKIKDDSIIVDSCFREQLITVAQQNEIPYQREILPGADTEAGILRFERGISTVGGLSIPTRYLHTGAESIHTTDLEATTELLTALLEADQIPTSRS